MEKDLCDIEKNRQEEIEMINKDILIIVPHQDDETNLAGGLIWTLSRQNSIRIVYVTNGDYCTNFKTRRREAVKACKKLGIKKEKIIFLGYPDTSYSSTNHMYTSRGDFLSKAGHSKTYGLRSAPEYCFARHGVHREYRVENLVLDLKELLLEYKPDLVICVDLDFHPDHIMTSLCLEKAVGEILNAKGNQYYPEIWKGFTYENSYMGPEDFGEGNKKMQFDIDKSGRLRNNHYYRIDESIDFEIDKKCYSKWLMMNPVWKAINKHKSQLFVNFAFRVINANNVFWRRETRNLIHEAKVSVSSSNKSYLYDFLLNDTSRVVGGDKTQILYDKGVWIPKDIDKEKTIEIIFDGDEWVSVIKLYSGNNNQDFVKNVELSIDGKVEVVDVDCFVTNIKVNRKCHKILLRILDKKFKNGLSEIEILGTQEDCAQRKEYSIAKDSVKFLFKVDKIWLRMKTLETKVIRKFLLRRKV